MRRVFLTFIGVALIVASSFAQSFVDSFDANSLGWTECAFESNKGSAVIDKGVMTN